MIDGDYASWFAFLTQNLKDISSNTANASCRPSKRAFDSNTNFPSTKVTFPKDFSFESHQFIKDYLFDFSL